jgi:hypothetical protein
LKYILFSEKFVFIFKRWILNSATFLFQKVKREMDFGHFKNVQNGKPEKSFEN